jgi:outer membrane protein W
MKIYYSILILFCLIPLNASARIALGPEIGYSYQTHREPVGNELDGNSGVSFGLSGVYQFENDLDRLGIDFGFGYSYIPKFKYRNVTTSGSTGTYWEGLDVISWSLGARYYFPKYEWQPFVGLGVGVQYFRRSSVSFRDEFNLPLTTPIYSNHFNIGLIPQMGIEYRPTFRWAVGIALRVPVAIRPSGLVPAIQIPLTIQVAF